VLPGKSGFGYGSGRPSGSSAGKEFQWRAWHRPRTVEDRFEQIATIETPTSDRIDQDPTLNAIGMTLAAWQPDSGILHRPETSIARQPIDRCSQTGRLPEYEP